MDEAIEIKNLICGSARQKYRYVNIFIHIFVGDNCLNWNPLLLKNIHFKRINIQNHYWERQYAYLPYVISFEKKNITFVQYKKISIKNRKQLIKKIKTDIKTKDQLI